MNNIQVNYKSPDKEDNEQFKSSRPGEIVDA